MKYVIFNYNNQQGNEQKFPYYAAVYDIQRNGTKLAEIFQRTNNGLLDPGQAIESVTASVNNEIASFILSEESSEIWSGAEQHDPEETITIELKEGVLPESLELFPGDSAEASESLIFFTSADGKSGWQELPAEKYGTNGWMFANTPEKYIRIQSCSDTTAPWQIRQVLLYGKP